VAFDERRLVELAKQGDTQAFGQLYQLHVDRVYSYILFRVRDSELAQDLTQDVFLHAFKAIGRFTWQGKFAPWLLRIGRNAIIDHWRKDARRPEQPAATDAELEVDTYVDVADAIAEVDLQIDRERLLMATSGLTELQQQVLALRFAAGMSIAETAEAMGKSEDAVKNLQHHALANLRRVLSTHSHSD
jgi:RNA polymerase sigma-70 factor (ECF subfamily)